MYGGEGIHYLIFTWMAMPPFCTMSPLLDLLTLFMPPIHGKDSKLIDDIIDWLREWDLVVLCWCTNAHHTRTPTPPHVITTVKLISSHLCKWFQQCNWILRIHCALGPSLKRIRRSQAVRRCLREEGSSICKHCRSAARRAGLEGDPAQDERQLPPAAIWYGGLNCRIGKRTPYYPYLSLSPVGSYVIVMGLSMTARVGDCWNAHAICTQCVGGAGHYSCCYTWRCTQNVLFTKI